MSQDPNYDAFLSYNSLDRGVVLQVADALTRRNCSTFLDQWYLTPGHDWVAALERALAGSRAVVIFVGPHLMGRWQQRERVWALDRMTEHDDFPVVPVLLPGCEPPLGFLKQIMWVDLRDDPTDVRQLDALAAAIRGERLEIAGVRQPRSMICPYRGLLAFREEDAAFFFGRNDYRDQLFDLLSWNTFVAVVGASGSGKSSLVGAGLVPKLRESTDPVWDIVRVVPDIDPLHSLANALVPLIEPDLTGLALGREIGKTANDLATDQPQLPLWGLVNEVLRQQSGTDRLLLFVDQWEELYTTCEDSLRRERFISQLLEATSRQGSRLSVVFTIRGDFYVEVLKVRPLVDRVQTSQLSLGPMDSGELRKVIEGPAHHVGLKFQDGLVQRIIKEAGNEPGRLPLLEFALEELWKRRDGDYLTHAAYEDLGGKQSKVEKERDCLGAAIATFAERLYAELVPADQDALPGLFRRLVRAGAKTDNDTRRRVGLSELGDRDRTLALKLVDQRLLTSSGAPKSIRNGVIDEVGGAIDPTIPSPSVHLDENDATIEIAHEELLRRWSRLKQWVDEDRVFLLWRTRLELKVEEFQRDGESASLRGRQVEEAKKYYPTRSGDLSERQRGFLDSSYRADRRERLLRRRGIIAAVVMGCLGLVGWYLYDRNQDAETIVGDLLVTSAGGVPYYLKQLDEYANLAIPKLHHAFSEPDREPSQRLHAAYALSRFEAINDEESQYLLDSCGSLTVPRDEGPHLVAALARVHNRTPLGDELGERVQQADRDAIRNRYLAISLSLGITDQAEAICKLDEDPTERTALIHGLKDFPGDIKRTVQVAVKAQPDLRSALIAAIGTLGPDEAGSTQAALLKLFRTAGDGGTHGAADWALREQGYDREELEKIAVAASENRTTDAGWYVNSQGMTMVLVPGGQFGLGPVDDGIDPRPHHTPRSFKSLWMSDREVTRRQFFRLVDSSDADLDWNEPEVFGGEDGEHPIQNITWYNAVRFCNELSKMEGLIPFYAMNIRDDDNSIDYVSIQDETGTGYRLPTEHDWEYACRALSATRHHFGEDTSLLSHYAAFDQSTLSNIITSPGITAERLPNGWGIFDLYGNVHELCENRDEDYWVVIRGGSYGNPAELLRSAFRGLEEPDDSGPAIGLRICRNRSGR